MPKLNFSFDERPAIQPAPSFFPAAATQQLAQTPAENRTPLWIGPRDAGWFGGVTQSMLASYLGCRERFRIKYVLGLQPAEIWEKRTGYGNMWHAAEEIFAYIDGAKSKSDIWPQVEPHVVAHATEQMKKFPYQRAEIQRWVDVLRVQFPEYVKHWTDHPDIRDRKPLMQEQVFDLMYPLPSGRPVRLRGKMDSVDLVTSRGGIFLQENKVKGDVEQDELKRQLKFDLQTMLYFTVLELMQKSAREAAEPWADVNTAFWQNLLVGVRYNVVRRPFAGGKGNIKQHEAKRTKETVSKKTGKVLRPSKVTPAETVAEFYERLRADYISAEPDHWFFRFITEVSGRDVAAFRRQCLDPLLENLADDAEWWLWCLRKNADHWDSELRGNIFPNHVQRHFRFPFGTYNSLVEVGYSEYDDYLERGASAGLRRADDLFTELR